MFESALEVLRFVEAALAVREPVPDAVQRAIGIALGSPTQIAMWTQLTGTVERGPVESVKLSYRPDLGSGSVYFHVRTTLSPPIMHELLDLERYGPTPVPDVSLAPPPGVRTYEYAVHGGAKTVTFQFTGTTHQLLYVSVAWNPRAEIAVCEAAASRAIELRVVPHKPPLEGYHAETDPTHQLLGLWLDEVGDGGVDDYDIQRLWHEIGAHLRGGGPISKTHNAFTLQVNGATATLSLLPAMRTRPLVLPLGDLADATERWFDVVAPETANLLRWIRVAWRQPH
jgi:hypothetical protein